jgi:gliding motility-associated lipoprotein GldD
MNLDYPKYKARIHISYKNMDNHPLYKLTEDARKLAYKHAPKAIGIQESSFVDAQHQIYAHTYRILGNDAASPYQFYLSDSSRHFVRGALYFNVSPNNDSLQPVIDHIVQDIDHLIQSFRWEEVNP